MDAQELTLNIAVNLGRVARWASEGRLNRVSQFLEETESYLKELESAPKSQRFTPTFEAFKKVFRNLKTDPKPNKLWAEDALTWANILTHRAKLA